jgi:hypothetical protein
MSAARFSRDLKRFSLLVGHRQRLIHAIVASKLHESVVDGSAITGSPGQPVDTGNLKTSFVGSFPEDLVWELTTNVVYAPGIEEGVGPHGRIQIRSEVGGIGSVKKTVAGFDRIVRKSMSEIRQ